MRGEPLMPDAFSTVLTEKVPELLDLADLEVKIVFNLDSSDVGPEHWELLAREINTCRDEFDGFVIIHGTDTMAFTASALSFALLDLGKPVVLTGAQRPLAAVRTDGRRNLVDAVDLATRPINDVGICFDGLFLRGSRTTKSNSNDYRGFESPGIEPLAKLGVEIVFSESCRPLPTREAYRFRPSFEPAVLAIHVVPGFGTSLFEELITGARRDLRGLVLAAYGSGTVPRRGPDLTRMVAKAVDAGIEVLVVTQSAGQVDLNRYENSRELQRVGAISGGEMSLEAGVTKMMHALAQFDDSRARRTYLLSNVVGERKSSLP